MGFDYESLANYIEGMDEEVLRRAFEEELYSNESIRLYEFSDNVHYMAIWKCDIGDLSKIEDNTRLNSLVSHELMTVNEKFRKRLKEICSENFFVRDFANTMIQAELFYSAQNKRWEYRGYLIRNLEEDEEL